MVRQPNRLSRCDTQQEPSVGLGGEQFKKWDVQLSRTFLQLEGSYTFNPDLRIYGRWRLKSA